jgi:hypothetical protein
LRPWPFRASPGLAPFHGGCPLPPLMASNAAPMQMRTPPARNKRFGTHCAPALF